MVRVQLARLILLLGCSLVACVPRNTIVEVPTVEVTVRDVIGHRIDASEPDKNDDGRAAGDLVEVEWRGSWWPAVLLERRRAGWMVHYDGYSNDWDEVVTLARIRDRRARGDGTNEPSIEPMDEDNDP
jgi:hypothetical protein